MYYNLTLGRFFTLSMANLISWTNIAIGFIICLIIGLLGWFKFRPWYYEERIFDLESQNMILTTLDGASIPTDDTLVIPYVETEKYESSTDDAMVTVYQIMLKFKPRTDENAEKIRKFAASGAGAWRAGFDGSLLSTYMTKIKKSDLRGRWVQTTDFKTMVTAPVDASFSFTTKPLRLDFVKKSPSERTSFNATILNWFVPKQVCSSVMNGPAPKGASNTSKFFNLPALAYLDNKSDNLEPYFDSGKYIACKTLHKIPILESCADSTPIYKSGGTCVVALTP